MQKLPVGISDFRELIKGNYYFVDKSLFIKEIIDCSAKIVLLPRPRRFGKTLNMTMLRYFYEKTEVPNKELFEDLAIWEQGREYQELQGKFPVIFLTFKDIKELEWEAAYQKTARLLQDEFLRHKYLLDWEGLDKVEKVYFQNILNLTATKIDLENALKHLSFFLERYYNQKAVILIDEYDTPIQAAYVNKYYDQMISFMRNFLSAGLKDNVSLAKGVLTGILRIAKESIFSGLNNLAVYTLIRPEFADKFGITETEIETVLKKYNLPEKYPEAKKWYNGYTYGNSIIYNPWSIVNWLASQDKEPRAYWVNTSDNALIEQLLTNRGQELKAELDYLIKGETILAEIEENIVFADIDKRENLLWSFLLFSGYLKYVKLPNPATGDPYELELTIPNKEVATIYTRLVKRWFSERIQNEKQRALLKALVSGDIKLFERYLRDLVLKVFSFHDFGSESEKVYQAFMIGLCVWLDGKYLVKSNRESGLGRYDLMLIPQNKNDLGFVIEFKKIDNYENENLEIATAKAWEQLEAKKYETELVAQGITNFRKMVIVFEGKQLWVTAKI